MGRPFLALVLAAGAIAAPCLAASDAIDSGAMNQIQALLEDKASRTPAQQKIDSNLLYESRQVRGDRPAAGVDRLQTGVDVDFSGFVVVDITAKVDDALLAAIESFGGTVVSSNRESRSLRARLPIQSLEALAASPSVIFIQREQEGMTWDDGAAPSACPVDDVSSGVSGRAARVRARLAAALESGRFTRMSPEATASLNVSEGDVTHRANLARSTYGAVGAGRKIGVLSSGVDSLSFLQVSGDLPAVTVLPGQAGSGDEGSAMLEIVHDLAPAAKLFFATGNGGITQFAQNIRDLQAAGCDIIVDDVFYFVETPFQAGQAPSVISSHNEGVVTQAVNDVSAAGALYFSSAGNDGNLDAGQSGTWEGDFVAAGGAVVFPEAGTLLDFDQTGGVSDFDTLTTAGLAAVLHWADPLGGSANDYDLFVLNSTGTSIVAQSTNLQNGTQDPIEQAATTTSGSRIVVVKTAGAAARFLHLATLRGRLDLSTSGAIFGHSATAAANAFGVAATPVAPAFPSPFDSSDAVETFSSDGPRRIFFHADGTPITPGNFSSTGGQVLSRPEITAADGVSCGAPGFDPFFGTSAAAPHAAAIAALVKSVNPSHTPAQVRTSMTSTAIDIQAAGSDRDSGSGILDAFAAVQNAGATAKAAFIVSNVAFAEASGNGNGFVEPGECGALTVTLQNVNATVGATGISATISTSTPGVTLQTATSGYPNIAAGASAANATPFLIGISNTAACPLSITFTLTITFTGGDSPEVLEIPVREGLPAVSITTTLDSTAPTAVTGMTGASTGLETSRLFRSGAASECGSAKAFPGTSGSGTRRFDAYTFANCASKTACIRVTLLPSDPANFELQAVAYSGSFNPSSIGTNYAADAGVSGGSSFAFDVTGGESFTVVVNELDSGGGIGDVYTLTVDGACYPCAVYSGPGTCCPSVPSGTITAPTQVCSASAGNTASVSDAGVGATYVWTIGNGTITGGNGTRAITFTAGASGSVSLGVTVSTGASCTGTGSKSVTISQTCRSPLALAADPTDGASSDGNGVFEPGETAVISPKWKNVAASTIALTGTASAFTGPAGATYTIVDSSASYGSIVSGASADCLGATGNCYSVTLSNPASRPAAHWDATLLETLSSTETKTWTLHVGNSFTDVPKSQPFYRKIETLLHTGITSGCTTTTYCPADPVSRGSMAIFIAKGVAGGGPAIPTSGTLSAQPYNCTAGGTSAFTDVLPTDIFCKHVHYIAVQNVTLGCDTAKYCPGDNVTRIQMASFIAKAIVAPGGGGAIPMTYGPDPVTGLSYSCNTGSPNIHFTDVPATDAFCKHVHFLWAKGIIAGCGAATYCPGDLVTRDAMAKFLSNAFNLALYGP